MIETKNYYGEIVYDEEGRWFKSLHGQGIRITSPLLQNKSHEIALYRALKGQIKPIPVVVYVKNNAPYLPDENVINLKDLLFFIECAPYDHEFSPLTMDKIKAAIERESVDVSLCEHVENIRVMKEVRKEKEAEMAYAIEKRLCPWCGGKTIVQGDLFRCSNVQWEKVKNKEDKDIPLCDAGYKLNEFGKPVIHKDGSITTEFISDYSTRDKGIQDVVDGELSKTKATADRVIPICLRATSPMVRSLR